MPKGSNIRLILAMNVLAHTDNINEFLPEVVDLMGPDTTFVSQSHWLAALVRNFEFDTIYHEHLDALDQVGGDAVVVQQR